nr:MAG TPA: hypothetical protein [Caudoviricetes sp.]
MVYILILLVFLLNHIDILQRLYQQLLFLISMNLHNHYWSNHSQY